MHLISLGCARNEVDSEELAGRLAAGGFALVDDPDDAEAIVVNTCGFIDAAKKDSIDTLLDAADHKAAGGRTKAVVAVGCLAERYGRELAESLPEADAVLGFDAYPEIAAKLEWILAGGHVEAHLPRDRRSLLPVTPVARPARAAEVSVPGHAIPGHAWIPRHRLASGASAPLKIASGCDRRCAFCAIPFFRGSYLSRPVDEVVAEARWLVEHGVREVVLVSENSSAYGKDLGTTLEQLLAPPGRRGRAGLDPGLVPAAGRGAAVPDRGDAGPGAGGAVLRPAVPARLRPGTAPDAPVRGRRILPRPDRPDPSRAPPTPGSAAT